MLYLILFLQLPVLIALSYYLNTQKLYARSSNIIITSIFEGFGTYLIIISLILEGFIANPFLQAILFVIGFVIVAFTKNNINEDEPELDVQAETMKNLIVIFTTTIVLFFVMLSVFRFQHVIIQFLLALLVVVLFNGLAFYLRKGVSNLFDILNFKNAMNINYVAIYIFAVVSILVFSAIFLNFPKVSANQALNLNNSNTYFTYPDGPVDLVNRYKTDGFIDSVVEAEMDENAYMNRDGDHVFIFVSETLIIFNIAQDEIIYTGDLQLNVDGIDVPLTNEETNEARFETDCQDEPNCTQVSQPYVYGDMKYRSFINLMKFDDLAYTHSDTAIFNDDVFHLFDNEAIDSRLLTDNDRPFFGFNESQAEVTDVDNYDGVLFYLQVEEEDQDTVNIKVYEVIEKDIDVELPFYSHYRLGMLIFIFILGFIPITNFDLFRTEIH